MSPRPEPGVVRYLRLDSQGRLVPVRRVAEHGCHRIIMHDLWALMRDPVNTLREAARLLRLDCGRLEIVERESRIQLKELVRLLENNGWDVYSSANIGEDGYRVEAAVCDESVTS